jgi:UDP:flavonoid glycosyltransferase YjiC (YdhE family)
LGGGFGHLTRSVALARAASSARVQILTNSPYADRVLRAMPGLNIASLAPSLTVSDARVEVARHIAIARPKCLIVDTFPRGLVGDLAHVLPTVPGHKILVQRDLNPEYAEAFDLAAFTKRFYDLVLDAGDTGAADPWLVRSEGELLTADRAREELALSGERPCVLLYASGNADELAWYGAVAAGLSRQASWFEIRCIAPNCPDGCPTASWRSYWPAIDLLAAAALVIGGGGYNTVYECLGCGVPLIARPWTRKYDRQRLRLERAACHGTVTIVKEPAQAIAEALRLLDSGVRTHGSPQFSNGAHAAAQRIAQLPASNLQP